ncbi:hypothetical protein KSS87_008461 [Heliosperma pusillum]|nr:hypothetical protein KSS87_008461 [Heliosperma pusillum]
MFSPNLSMATGNSKVQKTNVTLSLLLMALLLFSVMPTEAQIGLTYGQEGNNLPSPQQVVKIYQANGIRWMRIYFPDPATLQAIRGSGVTLLLDVPNDQVQNFAQNPSLAVQWVQQNVVPYAECIAYLLVGNEVPQNTKQYVGPAMSNALNALRSFSSVTSHIKVTTAIGMSELTNTYPPSNGQFADLPFMGPIVNFLQQNGSPLMLNVYPYFAYIDNKAKISQDYALFTSPGTVLIDPNNGLQYQNLYDALVDSVYAALARQGASNGPHTGVMVSETGWPSAGGDSSSVPQASSYYNGMVHHAKYGTPRNPRQSLVILHSAFDENQKKGDATEQHFGVFNTNGTPKYPGLNLNS